MCLAVPARIVSISDDRRTARVDFGGVEEILEAATQEGHAFDVASPVAGVFVADIADVFFFAQAEHAVEVVGVGGGGVFL